MNARPAHAAITQFPIVADALQVGGFTVQHLAERVGRTPFYAYDSAQILARIASVRACIPDSIRLHYAIKANPMPQVVELISGQVDGLDVASGRELVVALATGTAPEEMSFAGPGKAES